MEVFISWSGKRSERVAEALRDWLPSVIQSIIPFMSASDIEKGSRWSGDLATHLEAAQFGLICLTQDNLQAPWLLFEAGALSKSLENSRVVPYLYGISQTQLEGPLAQFQAAAADKNSTLDVLKSINGALEENGLDAARLESAFETWWPQLKEALESIPEATEEAPPFRTDREVLEEVLSLTRQMSRQSAPSLELEHETFRNLLVHRLPPEQVDSSEGLDAERPKLSSDAARRRRLMYRRSREREESDADLLRKLFERWANVQPSSESEDQSSNESDKEA